MAGNIIPAIATTNAIIAGLLIMEALKVLTGKLDQCKTVSNPNNYDNCSNSVAEKPEDLIRS